MTTDLLLSVQNFMMEVCPHAGYDAALEVHMDASSAIHAAVAPAMLPKYKHIPLHAQKVRTHAQLGDIVLRKIDTADNTADQGTKPYSSMADYKRRTAIFMITDAELVKRGFKRCQHD